MDDSTGWAMFVFGILAISLIPIIIGTIAILIFGHAFFRDNHQKTAIKRRNIIVFVLISIFIPFFGQTFWMCLLADDMRLASGDQKLLGYRTLLLTWFTCGIYGIYWAYLMGKAQAAAKAQRGLPADDNSALYLVLQILGFGFITCALVQNELNNMVTPINNNQQQGA